MSKESQIETIKHFLKVKEETLASMVKRRELLNKAIPELEQDIEAEKARLAELERSEG